MTAVLEAIGMEKRFPVKQQMLLRRRDTFQALQGIDLALYSGQTLGVVGESGSGKSTLGEIFGDLQQPTSGIVRYKGQDIRSLGEKEYRRFRRNVQYIFQNPKESMNPYYTVERILVEPMKILVDGFKPHKARETVREMLNRVGLPDSTLGKYPSELSGGQCQRIAIARALLLSPEVIICDECVFRAGCVHSGADPESAEGSSKGIFYSISLYLSRYWRDPLYVGFYRCD